MISIQKDIKIKLKETRKKIGLTQKELAKLTHLSVTKISRFESEKLDNFPNENEFDEMINIFTEQSHSEKLEDEIKKLVFLYNKIAVNNENTNIINNKFYFQNKINTLINKTDPSNIELEGLNFDIYQIIDQYEKFKKIDLELTDGNIEEAKIELEYLEEDCLDKNSIISMFIKIAFIRYFRYKDDESDIDFYMEKIKEVKKIAFNSGEEKFLFHVSLLEGDIYKRFGQIEQALKSYKRCKDYIEAFEKTEIFKRNTQIIYRKNSASYNFLGEASKGKEFANKSIKIAKDINDLRGLIKGYEHLAWSDSILGFYDQALEIQENNLKRIEKINEKLKIKEKAKSMRYRADVLLLCKEYKKALKLYDETLFFLKLNSKGELDSKERLIRGPIFLGLGKAYKELGNINQAKEWLERSRNRNKNDLFFSALTDFEYGKLYFLEDELEKANFEFDNSKEKFINLGNMNQKLMVDIFQSELLISMKEFSKAKKLIENIDGEINKSTNNKLDFLIHDLYNSKNLALLEVFMFNEEESFENLIMFFDKIKNIIFYELKNKYIVQDLLENLEYYIVKQDLQNVYYRECDNLVRKNLPINLSGISSVMQVINKFIENIKV